MAQVQSDPEPEIAYRWMVRGIYAALIGANLWIAFEWWVSTDQGQAAVARWNARVEEAKAKAAGCEGCARRKASLRAAMNRMHWQAQQIVEGEEVETHPEATP